MEEMDKSNGKLSKFEKIIKDSFHPTVEELGSYILFKNGIEDDKSILKLIPQIDQHLRKCSKCNSLFLELNNEYVDLDNFLLERKPLAVDTKSQPAQKLLKPSAKYFKFSGVALAIICLLIFGMFSVSHLVTPASIKYAQIGNIADLYETRGRVSDDFQESLKSFENRDYDGTVNWLKKDIVDNRGDETIFYSYYILGLAYLESSKTDFIGLFPSYDNIKVNNGISALNKALQLNNSGRFLNINLDIYFFLAKADLMMNNLINAKTNLKKVISEKGSNMNEAKMILSGLE